MSPDVVTYPGELAEDGQISIETRDLFLEHYRDHLGCQGFHSCPQMRRLRKERSIEQGGPDPDQAPDTCPVCGAALVERKSRKTGEPFIGCSGYPECNYIHRPSRFA